MHSESNDKKMEAMKAMFPFPLFPDNESVKYYKQALQVSVHHFYIVDEIKEVSGYLDMINVIKTAEGHDTVFIYLNTPGGNLYTAIQIISAIRQSNATIITCLEGEVASAGTLIFLAGHKHVVNANCTFMIHNYSHWVGGKGNEVALRVKYSEQYFKKLAVDLYGGFLNPTELEEVIAGKDFWMDSEEVLGRLNKETSSMSINDMMDSLASGGSGGTAENPECEEPELEVVESTEDPVAVPQKKKRARKSIAPNRKLRPS